MKIVKSMLIAMVGLLSPIAANSTELAWYESAGAVFKIHAPSGWKVINTSKYFQVAKPDQSVVLTISAWGKDGGSIKEFAEYRFSSVEKFYKAQTEVKKLNGGLAQEYEGTWPGESKPTYYVVSAIEKGGAYFSINLVTDRADFEKNRKLYYSMIESVAHAHNN